MSTTLADGTVFARRFRVVRLIAAGAMGSVHEVVHLETQRRRALKVMHAHLFQRQEMRERFKLEARIAANIESEYIVDVFDAGVDEATGMPFLVMELLRGEELGACLKRLGRLPSAEVVTYLYQTALALDRTHAASIVHRDLKPANLFLQQREDGSMRVKILDFGVAKFVAEGATAAGTTQVVGTPTYMAPEQFRNGNKLTGAADIYALGMMAYTMLVGTPYWAKELSSVHDLIGFVLVAIQGPPESSVQRAWAQGAVLPPSFDAWFACATAVDPGARFRTAMEAVCALGEVLGVPLGGARAASFPNSPSGPGVVFPPPAGAVTALSGSDRVSRPQVLELAGTSTGAAVSAVPARSSRRPLLSVVAVLGLGVLGAGTWLALRSGGGSSPVASTAPEVAATTAVVGEAGATPSPATASAVRPAVVPATAPEPATAPASARAPAAAPASAAAPAKPGPKPVSVVKAPRSPPSTISPFGRN